MFTIKRKLPKRVDAKAKVRPFNWEYILHVPETVRAATASAPPMPSASIMVELASRELKEWQDLGMIRRAEGDSGASVDSHPQILQPMLSSPITSFDQIDVTAGDYLYEEKFDGERMLCFVRNCDDVYNGAFYSRTLKPMNFPYRIPINPGYRDCILDGELVFLNPGTGEMVAVCDTGDRRELRKQYRVFDIQMLNGEYVHDRPLLERKRILGEMLSASTNVSLVDYHRVSTRDQLMVAFDDVLARHGEGLILKRTQEAYQAGRRAWTKIKELHLNGRKLEFDLYVNRMMYDKNNILSVLECGYFDSSDVFRRVCLVSSGLDTKTRASMRRMSRGQGVFKPRQLIVTIIADKITKNGSLRHPIFHRIRSDLVGRNLEIDPRLADALNRD